MPLFSRYFYGGLSDPETPADVEIGHDTENPETELVIKWNTNDTGVSYIVTVKNSANEIASQSEPIPSKTFIAKNLIPGELYSAVVVANNSENAGGESSKVSARTSEQLLKQ